MMPDLPDDIPCGNERILFVDDEKLLAELGSNILGRLGYNVVSKTDPKEALNIFSQDKNAFDLVFTDLTMPEMKGDELAKKILMIRPDIPVILCTGFDNQLNEIKTREIGITALIAKPVAMKDMAVIVRKCLDGSIHYT
ncbi:response regulator [Thermodesulfobacteriota bacterium]